MERNGKYANLEEAVHFNDQASFNSAFRSYYQPLRFYASKFVRKDDAEDIIENLFLKLWDKQQTFQSSRHLQAFLYHAVRNACLDVIKLSKQGKTDEISEELSLSNDEDHLRYMIEAETLAEIYRAVNGLPTQCSKVIRMGYLEGFNNAEIAEQLGLSEKTVKNYKLRGLEILRKNLPGNSFSLFMLLFY